MTVLHVVPGPDRHGVTRHALTLLARRPLQGHECLRVFADGTPAAEDVRRTWAELPADMPVHLHLTDHLLGPSAGDCAERVIGLARHRPVTLTLHDLPQPTDGPGRYERRRAAYAAMAGHARGVVVAGEHERSLLTTAVAAEGGTCPPVEVVPLPIEPPRADVTPRAVEFPRRVVVFGFLYPGKGHAHALDALAGLPQDVGLLALGEVSPGHEDLVDELTARAKQLGRTFEVSGHVEETDLERRLHDAAVPVAPHLHVSASGSIGSWLSAGRRPVVPAGTYVDEIEERCPGALLRYGPGLPWPDLGAALSAALENPTLTWLDGVEVGPDADTVARRYAEILAGWTGGTP